MNYIYLRDEKENNFIKILKMVKDLLMKRPHRPTIGLQASNIPRLGEGKRGNLPIAMKISFTFIAVFADVSMNSKLLSSA